jgi:hypothetical protein
VKLHIFRQNRYFPIKIPARHPARQNIRIVKAINLFVLNLIIPQFQNNTLLEKSYLTIFKKSQSFKKYKFGRNEFMHIYKRSYRFRQAMVIPDLLLMICLPVCIFVNWYAEGKRSML